MLPGEEICMHNTYMPNKTISVPDDVIPIIESLDMPFSRWVTEHLRRHAAESAQTFSDQLLVDAQLAGPGDRVGQSDAEAPAVGERMERSAPW